MTILTDSQTGAPPRFSPLLLGFHGSLTFWKTSLALGGLTKAQGPGGIRGAGKGTLGSPTHPLQQALLKEATASYQAFYKGVQLYEKAARPAEPHLPPPVWEKGSARLYDFKNKYPSPGGEQTVFFVPSLINKSYIFDLNEASGFLSYLSSQGIRSYLFDWGACQGEEASFTLQDALEQRLLPAFQYACRQEGGALSLAGYCMGGLFATALSHRVPALVKSLSLLAMPWDFHQGAFSPDRMEAVAQVAAKLFEAPQKVPPVFLQVLFHLLRPFEIQKKFQTFYKRAQEGAQEEAQQKTQQDPPQEVAGAPVEATPLSPTFFAVEDWLNDGVPLSLKIFEECCRQWYGQNTPYQQGAVAGTSLKTGSRDFPVYVVAPTKDRLVPEASARAVLSIFPGASVLAPETGHVGLFGSHRAQKRFWTPYAAWLKGLD